MVKIGHASINEKNTISGGKAGDNNTKEVCFRSWYNKPWSYVLRPKDKNIAEKMAKACEDGCMNDCIGYSQPHRNSLKQQAKLCGMDLSRIKTDCECDCSSFMTVCAECAGIAIPYNGTNAPTTSTMKDAFISTKYFQLLTDDKYLTSDKYLQRGDILVAIGKHTIMVLENGELSNTTNVDTIITPTTFAIDISANQGNINFAKVKESGISKVILRSTTKNMQPDIKWNEYLKGCDNNKIDVECYKYSYALNTTQAVSEANSVLALLNNRKMFIWLDLENREQRNTIGKQGITLIANAFLNTCENAGYKCGIYCNLDWYNNCIDNSLKSKYKFWIARYPKNDTGQIINPLKPNVGEVMWQYTSKGKISGINGDVDIDMICDSINEVQEQIGGNTSVTKGIQINNTINASVLNVRSHPALIAPIKYTLNRNEKVKIYGYFMNWYAISKTLDEWVSADYILTAKGIVTASKLNSRTDAGMNSEVLGQYNKEDILNILSEKKIDGKTWYLCVNLRNNSFGWASSEYIIGL